MSLRAHLCTLVHVLHTLELTQLHELTFPPQCSHISMSKKHLHGHHRDSLTWLSTTCTCVSLSLLVMAMQQMNALTYFGHGSTRAVELQAESAHSPI